MLRLLSFFVLLNLWIRPLLGLELDSIVCLDERTSSLLEMKKVSPELYEVEFSQDGYPEIKWELGDEAILNDNDSLFRLHHKSFGYLNWESIDLRFHIPYRIVRVVYRYKETGWSGKSTFGNRTVNFQNCTFN